MNLFFIQKLFYCSVKPESSINNKHCTEKIFYGVCDAFNNGEINK